MQFLLKITLWVAVVVGAGLAIQAGLEQRQLAAEYQRLQRKVGNMPITDPTKMHLVAIETDDPLYFLWRVHIPPCEFRWHTEGNGDSSSSHRSYQGSEGRDGFLRIRIRRNDNDELRMFTSCPNGSSEGVFANRDLSSQLTDAPAQLEVKQLGRDGVVCLERDQIATVLRIELKDSFKHSILEKLPEWQRGRLDKPMLSSQIGTSEAFAQAQSLRGANDE